MESQPNRPAGASPKLLDQVRQVMRLRHYSIHTERAYLDWIKRYGHFHRMKRREDLEGGEAKIEEFLAHLVVKLIFTRIFFSRAGREFPVRWMTCLGCEAGNVKREA